MAALSSSTAGTGFAAQLAALDTGTGQLPGIVVDDAQVKVDQPTIATTQIDTTKLPLFMGSDGGVAVGAKLGAGTQSWLKTAKSLNQVTTGERAARTAARGTPEATDMACPAVPQPSPAALMQGMAIMPAILADGPTELTGTDAGLPPAGRVAEEPLRSVLDVPAIPVAGAHVATKPQDALPFSPPVDGEEPTHAVETQSGLSNVMLLPVSMAVEQSPAVVAQSVKRPASAITEQVAPAILSVVSGAAGPVLTLHLNPAELGAIRVTVDRDAAGGTGVTLTVERPETMRLLKDDMAHLNAALDMAGIPQTGRTLALHMQVPDAASAPVQGVAHDLGGTTTASVSMPGVTTPNAGFPDQGTPNHGASSQGTFGHGTPDQGTSDQAASGTYGDNRGGQRQPLGVPRQVGAPLPIEDGPNDGLPYGIRYRAGIDITA